MPFALLVAPLAAQTAVRPRAETFPVRSSGDAADDAVVWVHPVLPGLSTVIGTDKRAGLVVYDLAGEELQFLPVGRVNNVDLRHGFVLAGVPVALVAAGARGSDLLELHAVDPRTRRLHDAAAGDIRLGIDVYGACMYRSRLSGRTYFFGTSKDGEVEQWLLLDTGGRVAATRVRSFDVGGQTEGCVADDESGFLFVGEEDVGIWRYQAEPDRGDGRVLVDRVGAGRLAADVEGLTLYHASRGGGYLIASSQGDDAFVVYDRLPPHAHRATFRVGADPALGIDAVEDTDGIDVTNLALGDAFPDGLLVVQDGSNPGSNQNFKLVPWSAVAGAASPPLVVDRTHDAWGARCARARWRHRAGSGVNRVALRNLAAPRLGASWSAALDCGTHAPGPVFLLAFARAGAGRVVGRLGEVLVDPRSPRLFVLRAGHGGGTARFDFAVPPAIVLCGAVAALQGACGGAPGLRLSNALDLRLGY